MHIIILSRYNNSKTTMMFTYVNDKKDDYVDIYKDITMDISFAKNIKCSLNISKGKTKENEIIKSYSHVNSKIKYTILNEYVSPYNFTVKHVSSIENGKKVNNVPTVAYQFEDSDANKYMDEIKNMQKYEYIISMDKLISIDNWSLWEVLVKIDNCIKNEKIDATILRDNDKIDCLCMSSNMFTNYVELIMKYRERYSKSSFDDRYYASINYNLASSYVIKSSPENSERIKKLREAYENNLTITEYDGKDCFDNNVYNNTYDFIVSTSWVTGDTGFTETNNVYYLVLMTDLITKCLKEKGNVCILLNEAYLKSTKDAIFMLSSCFNKSFLMKESNKTNVSYWNFIGISKLKSNESKNIKISEVISNFNNNHNMCNNNIFDNNTIISIYDIDKDFYDCIDRFQHFADNRRNLCINMRMELLRKYIAIKDIESRRMLLDEYQSKVIYTSGLWFKHYDVPIKFKYSSEDVIINIKKMLFEDTDIEYTYGNKSYVIVDRTNSLSYIDILSDIYGDYVMYQRCIDSIGAEEWYRHGTVNSVRHYGNLKYIVKKMTKRSVSIGFIKMYEILAKYSFFDDANYSNNINSFHICEAPGNFIVALNHYIKTNKKDKKLNWYGQSLNFENIINISKYGENIIDDQFGLIKKYPYKWDFGRDKTGDITNVDNLDYYMDKYKDINFMTSDCGMTKENLDGYVHKENSMSKLTISEILFVLSILKKGGVFVIKVFLPIKMKRNISLIYILFKSFEKLHVYKPLIKPGSLEVYFIGVNYLGADPSMIEAIKNVAKNINDNKDDYIIPVDDQFMSYHVEMTRLFLTGNKNHLLKKLFLYENQNFYTDNNINLEHEQEKMCNEWIKRFNFHEINSNDTL